MNFNNKPEGYSTMFYKNVSLGIISMFAQSLFILADTFFIANGIGAEGLAALNIVLPIVNIVNGLGWMFGVGGATLFATTSAQRDKLKANQYFSLTLSIAVLFGIAFTFLGLIFADSIIMVLGGTGPIYELAKEYYSIFMLFSIFFIINNCMITFLRNDNNPRLATIAFVSGGVLNIILDYIFIYEFKMGMSGAALATIISPILSLIIVSTHRFSKKRTLKFEKFKFKFFILKEIFLVGFSSFLNEFSSALIMFLFNIVLLDLVGNVAISAYAIVANLNIIAIAIFTGIGQGVQPLISKYYGERKTGVVGRFLKYGILSYSVMSIIFLLVGYVFTGTLVDIFNSEHNLELESIATTAIRYYFLSFIFTGVNFMAIYYFAAIRKGRLSLIISSLRGFILIIPILFVAIKGFGLTGVWIAMPLVELITFIFIVTYYLLTNKSKQ